MGGDRLAWLRDRRTLLALGLSLGYLLLAIPSARDASVAGDEVVYMKAAKVYGYYLLEAVTSLDPLDPDLLHIWSYNREHPPLAKLVSAVPWGLTLVLRGGDMPFELSVFAHRIGPILLSAAAVFVLTRWVAGTHGPWAGAAAGTSLVLLPRWFAHSRYAALDGPMSVMWLLTGWACWRAFDDRRWAPVAGLVFGLALATKLNAFFLPLALGLWALLARREVLAERVAELAEGRWASVARSPQGRTVLACAVLGPLVFFATWPWLWTETGAHLAGYFAKHLTHEHIPVHYLGTTYETAPWHYPFVMLGLTTPIPILALALAGGVGGLRDPDRERRSLAVLFAVFAAIPLLLLAGPSPKYNGTRLFLPSFPMVAGLAGIGFQALLDRAPEAWTSTDATRWALPVAGLVLIALPGLGAYATLDPYEESYFNELIGGPEGALEAGFELETWGQPIGDLVPWLNEQASASDPLAVYVPAGTATVPYYAMGDIGYVTHDLDPRYGLPDWIEPQQPPLEANVTLVEDRSRADVVLLVADPAALGEHDRVLFTYDRPAHSLAVDGARLAEVHRI